MSATSVPMLATMVMWIASSEQLCYLAAAVLLRCQQRRRDGYGVPPQLERLRDELHAVAMDGPERPVFADLAAVADLLPCMGGKLPTDSVGVSKSTFVG